MKTGTVPDKMKIARVIPIYKGKGEKHLFTNYRPISLLPVFSKILEKMIYSKIFEFLVRYQILFKSQYGFRKGRNTSHATIDFLQTIEKAFQDQEYAIGIFCDLSKAFDTLDHDILFYNHDLLDPNQVPSRLAGETFQMDSLYALAIRKIVEQGIMGGQS